LFTQIKRKRENRYILLWGVKIITRLYFASAAALGLPLVLGACGLPLGVQIASFVADGISIVATDKTLGDHGLSMVAQKDCALWRGLKGDEICRTAEPDIFLAKSGKALVETETAEAQAELGDEELAAMDLAAGAEDQPTAPAPAPAITAPVKTVAVAALTRPVQPDLPPVTSRAAPARTGGGIFYVIASYRKIDRARHMAQRQPGLGAKILTGNVKGRPVYRVAIGPVAKTLRRRTRKRLAKAGFSDAWKLALKKPRLALEVASLR
ncbi:MAG: SPOR domain-containing protein, partial [Rhodospirillales bacterium]|jgi:hypothetical protein|nr:SPOR domain-containing protein [Rhodospirillales bacterium]